MKQMVVLPSMKWIYYSSGKKKHVNTAEETSYCFKCFNTRIRKLFYFSPLFLSSFLNSSWIHNTLVRRDSYTSPEYIRSPSRQIVYWKIHIIMLYFLRRKTPVYSFILSIDKPVGWVCEDVPGMFLKNLIQTVFRPIYQTSLIHLKGLNKQNV